MVSMFKGFCGNKGQIKVIHAVAFSCVQDFVGKGVFSNVCKAKDKVTFGAGSSGLKTFLD